MDKSSKLYTKALKEYNKANIQKALELCEKSISLNLRNSAALNLKGLLLYLTGELEAAKAIWSLNKDINKDKVSKKYLDDALEDEKRMLLYNAAVDLIKEMRIKEAVQLLRGCEESDFNAINVSNALAVCLMRYGKYDIAKEHINKVLSIDNKNKNALETRRLLIEYGAIKKDSQYKGIVLYMSLTAIVVMLLYAGVSRYFEVRKYNNLSNNNRTSNIQYKNTVSKGELEEAKEEDTKKEAVKEEDNKKEEKKDEYVNKESFPYENLKIALEHKDYALVYNIVVKWKDKKLGVNEMSLFSRGEELIKAEGVEYFYSSGLKKIDEKDFQNAIIDLTKAYAFGESNYLQSHIIYMLAVSYEKIGDVENALAYYKYYEANYADGVYTETVLYNSALLYRNIDLKKSKTYAEQIADRYPNTMYNNSIIREILNK